VRRCASVCSKHGVTPSREPSEDMKGKAYKPFGGGPSKALISRAAKQAAKRAESYSFKTKNGDEGDVGYRISMEMASLAAERSQLIDPERGGDKWTTKSSLISAPLLASDMYLHCDRGSSSLLLQGPRFYHGELSAATEDPATSMPVPPDVSRFPYSDEAHAASKKLSAKLAKNLARRHYAAAVLQRSYRAMRSMQQFRREVQEAHMACRKLQCLWRKRLMSTRERRRILNRLNHAATRIQCLGRRFLARRVVRSKIRRKLHSAVITITRFMCFVKKEVKRRRGRSARRRIHATRIQSRWRALLGRRRLRRMIWAKRRIWVYWRAKWMRKKGVYARRLFNFLRQSILIRRAQRVHGVMRGFLGRRRFHRERLQQRAYERQRGTIENEAIRGELERDIRERCYSWITQPNGRTGTELQRDTTVDFMKILDVSSAALLHPSYDKNGKNKLERRLPIFPEMPLEPLLEEGGRRRAISLAVLSVFCNHPHGMIDWAALEVCKQFLTPVRSGLFAAFSHRNEEDAWSFLQSEPLIDIVTASALLEPTLSLRCRVTVQGRLPDHVLAQAVVVRRWTHHVDLLIKRAVWKVRLANPPKNKCVHCLEALTSPLAMRQHMPCPRFGWPSWVSRSFFQMQLLSLMNRLGRISAYPTMKRDKDKDEQFARMKVSSRREYAKRRSGAFASVAERNQHSQESGDPFSHIDANRGVDKKALRLAKGAAMPDSPATFSSLSGKKLSPGKSSPASTKKAPAQSPAQPASPASSVTSTPGAKVKPDSSMVLPPAGIDFVPFFEEYFPVAQEQLDAFPETEWENRPGVLSETAAPKSTRDKEGAIINFELVPDKVKGKKKKVASGTQATKKSA